MISFKQYLTEALTPSQAKEFKKFKMDPNARKNTNVLFPRGVDSIREELKEQPAEKSETHKAVEQHIGQEIDIPHYISGRTNPNKKGQQIRLGKVIKDPALLQNFSVDPSRAGGRSGASQGYVTIHRGLQVAGQTNPKPTECNPSGHSWAGPEGSCKNIETGGQRSSLKHEIQRGTVVMFGHDPSGKEIYRATLQPHHKGEHTIYTVNSQYGNKHPAFVAHAHDVAARLTSKGAPTDVVYKIAPKVYNDSGSKIAFHPDAPPEFVKENYYKGGHEQLAAAAHRNLPSEVIDQDIKIAYPKTPPRSMKKKEEVEAASNRIFNVVSGDSPAINGSHISKIIHSLKNFGSNDYDDDMFENLANHHKFSKEHIEQFLAFPKGYTKIREEAIQHPKVTKEIAQRVVNDPREHKEVRAFAMSHPGINEALLKKHAQDPSDVVAYAAASNPKLKSPEHLDEIAKSPNYSLAAKIGLMVNPHSTGSHVTDVINHVENSTARKTLDYKQGVGATIFTALRHPHVTPEHVASVFGSRKLTNILDDRDAENSISPEMFPNWKHHHITALIQSARHPHHIGDFLHHPAVNRTILRAARKHPNEEVRDAADDIDNYGSTEMEMWKEPTDQYLPSYNVHHRDDEYE